MTSPQPESVRLSESERAALLRTLDWAVESRTMTHATAMRVLGIADNAARLASPRGEGAER